jgi:hypothetical protein
MNKDSLPEDYTLGLAAFDAVPVVLFGLASRLLARMTGSLLVMLGGIICFVSGMLKVLWKLLVVLRRKNVWPLFVQMRIGMPAGFMVMLAGLIAGLFKKNREERAVIGKAVCRPAPIAFLLISVAGIGAMIFCGKKLDSAQARANWIEQGCNTAAQGSFLAAMALIAKKLR